MRRLASAIMICALAAPAAAVWPGGLRAQSLDSPKVKELYAAERKVRS
jgi:hypothetical protein